MDRVNLNDLPALHARAQDPLGRIDIATNYVATRLAQTGIDPTQLAAEGIKLRIHPTMRDFGGHADDPVSGRGPIEVRVTQRATDDFKGNFIARFFKNTSHRSNRLYLVDVDHKGSATLLPSEELTLRRRIWHAVKDVGGFFSPRNLLELGESLADSDEVWKHIKSSGGVTAGALGLGGALAESHPHLVAAGAVTFAVGAALNTAYVLRSVIRERKSTHAVSIASTAKWARALVKRGTPPTAVAAYQKYRQTVKIRPLSMEQFIARMPRIAPMEESAHPTIRLAPPPETPPQGDRSAAEFLAASP